MIVLHILLMLVAAICLTIAALFHPANMAGTPVRPHLAVRFGWLGMALWSIHVLLSIWPR